MVEVVLVDGELWRCCNECSLAGGGVCMNTLLIVTMDLGG